MALTSIVFGQSNCINLSRGNSGQIDDITQSSMCIQVYQKLLDTTRSTYTIGGTVKLNSVGVVGAQVSVLVADDASLSNAVLWGVHTTGAGGTWTSDPIPVGKYSYAYAQDEVGGVIYTSIGASAIT